MARNFQNSGFPFKNNSHNAGYYPQQNAQAYNQPIPFKKSGAKYSKITKGNFKGSTIVNAWNSSRQKGLVTAKIGPYKKSKVYTGEIKGNTYQTMIAEVTYHKTGHTRLLPCSMNQDTQVIVLSEIGMVVTPNGQGRTKSGKLAKGYFGKFISK